MGDLVAGKTAAAMSAEDARRQLEPCTQERAAELGAVLVGCYPRHGVDAPEIYTRGLVSLLRDYSAQVGSRAIDRLTRDSKYLPTRAELAEALEREASALRLLVAKEDAAAAKERERIAEDARRREVDAFKAKCLAETGKGPFDLLREKLGFIGGNKGKDDEKASSEIEDDGCASGVHDGPRVDQDGA